MNGEANLEEKDFKEKNVENNFSNYEKKEGNGKLIINETYISGSLGKEEVISGLSTSMLHEIYKNLINIKIPSLNSEMDYTFENGSIQNFKIPPFKITSRKVKSMNYLLKNQIGHKERKSFNISFKEEVEIK